MDLRSVQDLYDLIQRDMLMSPGSDGVNDDRRLFQCFLYVRNPELSAEVDSNHYAMPLDISPVIDTETMKVIRIDKLPTGADNTLKETRPFKLRPANEYLPEHQKLRTDLKPLQVIQPEGTSFRATQVGENGQYIEWQKWSFRVGFNGREGMVLYDVSMTYITKADSLLTAKKGPLRRSKPLLPGGPVGHEHTLR